MGIYNNKGWLVQVAYKADGTPLASPYDRNGDAVQYEEFRAIANVFELPSYTASGLFQGACTDGEYIYQICFDNSQYTTGMFIKYKISDGTVIIKTFDATIPYNHGNDMAYNPNTGHIYVAAMSNDGAVMELDTDFNYIRTHYLVGPNGNTYEVWGLCFDRNTNHFLSEYGNGMIIYDTDFNFISLISLPIHPDATGQGCETDGKFIYRVTYNPNYIDVAIITGEYVCTIELPLAGTGSHPIGEPETLMFNWANGRYYVNTNYMATRFYEVDLKEPPYPNTAQID